MKLIAHRGNINGPNEEHENAPSYILSAIHQGYEVEIDVWRIDDQLYLGHDLPKYKICIEFLLNNASKLWCHAKNLAALKYLLGTELNCFWHQQDDYTLTSKGFVWVYPGKSLSHDCICVMPEWVNYPASELQTCYGICSDHVATYKNLV